jgi:hypothetical protein
MSTISESLAGRKSEWESRRGERGERVQRGKKRTAITPQTGRLRTAAQFNYLRTRSPCLSDFLAEQVEAIFLLFLLVAFSFDAPLRFALLADS